MNRVFVKGELFVKVIRGIYVLHIYKIFNYWWQLLICFTNLEASGSFVSLLLNCGSYLCLENAHPFSITKPLNHWVYLFTAKKKNHKMLSSFIRAGGFGQETLFPCILEWRESEGPTRPLVCS